MKFNKFMLSLCFLIILGNSLVFTLTNEIDMILESIKDKRKRDIFPVFHSLHEKNYNLKSEEGTKRYKIFKANMKWIKEKNAALGKQVYGITPFMDLTDEEFKKSYLMDAKEMEKHLGDMNKANTNKNNFEVKMGDTLTGTPNFDWNYLYEGNPCKDQKSCGGCWSFSSNAAIEGNYRLNHGEKKDLSVQYFIDCDLNDNGCSGGWPSRTFKWAMENGVINGDISTYQETRTLCQSGKYVKHQQNLVKNFEYCEQNEAGKNCDREMWIGLLSKGPVVVAMDAEFEGFSKYKPGPDYEPIVPGFCGKLNHALVAVGLVTENGEDFLLVRNSWGPNWGKDGYFKISTKVHCGIMDNAWLPITQEHVPFPEKKCPKFYSECYSKGKSISTCYGENDFESSIGSNLKSYEKNVSENLFFNFFTEKNCKGEKIWNYQDVKCLTDFYAYEDKTIKSASSATSTLPWGCIQHFSESCYNGDATLICSSLPDLTKTDFKFTAGSIDASPYSIDNIFFFDEVKYQGKGFGVKGNDLQNYSDNAELLEIMKNAKSFYINVRDPNKSFDPDW